MLPWPYGHRIGGQPYGHSAATIFATQLDSKSHQKVRRSKPGAIRKPNKISLFSTGYKKV
jgi:hypothetical protein